MSFFDGLKDLAKDAGRAIKQDLDNRKERIERYKRNYERYDNDELIRKFRSSDCNTDQRIAIRSILNDRGCFTENE